jgi:replicative DNA helicase
LVIIAARPSMGKTAFALNVAVAAALARPAALQGRAPTVLFFSLEMGKQQIVQRMLCAQAGVEAYRLRTGKLPDEDWSALNDAAGVLDQTSLFIDDTPGLSVMSLRARARRLKAKIGLDLVFVDYLQLMSHPKAESRQMEISEISRSLKALARELDVPVVALAQLSRAVEGKDREPRGWPMLSDLRESGSIEQDADVVMMLYRPWYYVADKKKQEEERPAEEIEREKISATIIVAKHRNGPTGEVVLNFRERFMRFENPALSAAEPIFA